MKKKRRITALLLAGLMLFSAVPVDALATERSYAEGLYEERLREEGVYEEGLREGGLYEEGLCRHHPSHTAGCGYTEGVKGSLCTHEHTEDCFLVTQNCIHEHTEACRPAAEGDVGSAASPAGDEGYNQGGDSASLLSVSAGDTQACGHVCSEESGCIRRELNCPHEQGGHTEECGYVEAVPEKPCSYVCELCGGEEAKWPEAPGQPESPENLKDGEMKGEMYGRPFSPLSLKEQVRMQKLSQEAQAAEDPTKEIPDDDLAFITFIYINGAPYKGGDVEVTEGDNFSYLTTWSPRFAAPMEWTEGSWFERTLFTVPGLNLASPSGIPLNIGGVKVGEYSLTYNKDTGNMTYKVVFNRYIQFFDPSSVLAQVLGSGRFIEDELEGSIQLGEDEGIITISPRPQIPKPPVIPGGVGYQPPKAPEFNDNVYGFGKGIKWNNGSDPHAYARQLEWRVVFMEQLQKLQQEFAKNPEGWTPPENDGYVILKDTLDPNQRFYVPPEDQEEYGTQAPFYMELPVVVPGTGTVLNGSGDVGVGSDEYDGPGIIDSLYTGEKFRKITDQDSKKAEELVGKTPLSYTILTNPDTGQQTLIVNAGRLGTNNPTEGMVWSQSSRPDWPVENIQKKIDQCTNTINGIWGGSESPVRHLKNRATTLNQLLVAAVQMQENAEHEKEYQSALKNWQKDYEAWRDDTDNVNENAPLDDQKGNLLRPLPNEELLVPLLDCRVSPTDPERTIKHTEEYNNYITALENVQENQRIYLNSRNEYAEAWETARRYYENALEFYKKTDGVYGFVMKVRTESVNSSMTTYSNTVSVELGDKDWAADDHVSVTFAGGIVGSYSLGDLVLQKADAFYDSAVLDEEEKLQQVGENGLAGAKFKVYCEDFENPDNPPEQTDTNLAHFLDRDASPSGEVYLYTHTGGQHAGGPKGEIEELETDPKGRLAMSRMVSAHPHWVVETEAPRGYYLNDEMIRLDTESKKVNYKLIPNHSRSVLLKKIDSFSGNPVEGAEFTLYKQEGNAREEVKGFSQKELNQHSVWWKNAEDTGGSVLTTNADGELCIHGLDPGTYVLKETKPAPGYLEPQPAPEFLFTLEEKLPEKTADYDEDYHYLLNHGNPVENDPDTAALTMKKQGIGTVMLEGAGFALFRFKGTEDQWQENPDDEGQWEAVELQNRPDSYFKTSNPVTEITVPAEELPESQNPQWRTLQAVLTKEPEGAFTIENIPVGHYSVAEVQVPGPEYVRDYRSFYFTVDGSNVGADGEVQIYTEPQQKNELRGNTLKNYKKKAYLALVKYDTTAEKKPEPDGGKLEEGYQYTDKVLKDDSVNGLEGAVYKLFMRRGASVGVINPYPKELEDSEKIIGYREGYDTCVAMGTTDGQGVLKLEDMRGPNGNPIAGGLNPEEYYMIEVKAPEGFLLNQEAIHFSLTEKIFNAAPEDIDTAGLVMLAGNTPVEYGIRLTKVYEEQTEEGDTSAVGLPGAEFQVTAGDKELSFISTGDAGKYRLAAEGAQGAANRVFSGLDGKLDIVGLEPDTDYTVTETRAPRGYRLPENPEVIIRTSGSAGDGRLEGNVLYPKTDTQVKNERLLGRVELYKKSADTRKPLEGAEFTLYETVLTPIGPEDPDYDPDFPDASRREERKIAEGVTKEDGSLVFEDLPWSDHYYIVETKAPDGYMLDQTKRMFKVDEISFTDDGQAIPVTYPSVLNSNGTLGTALLKKADEEDVDGQGLPGAEFFLEKKMGEIGGMEIWNGYGKGIYTTDADGEIRFILPPGDYRLSEMKAPDGYIIQGMKQIPFTIEDTPDGSPPEAVIIDEEDSDDGVITNKKGESGVYLRKVLKGTDIPIPGVTFRIHWQYTMLDDQEIKTKKVPVYFIHEGDGNYKYTRDANAPEAVTELKTNGRGEIYAMFPKGFLDNPPSDSEYPEIKPDLIYEEIAAPEGIQEPYQSGIIESTHENFFEEISVGNTLKEEVQESISIQIQKWDGKAKKGLAGAEFKLFWRLEFPDGPPEEIILATGVTDETGRLTFDKNAGGTTPLKLLPGTPYYIQETKAPRGYVLDETVHEVIIDGEDFDEDFHFIPIELDLENYQVRGSAHLTKVSAENPDKGLPGGEFELLRWTEDASKWEHYGEERYITDEKGELLLENLPFGNYKVVERAAPLGYLLDNPAWEKEFTIAVDGERINLGKVENAADLNPVRDVRVKKVDAENPDKGLAGAEFEVYKLQEDGEYYPIKHQRYITGEDGTLEIRDLAVGNYALKELRAPEGYDVPDQNMTYFAVRAEEPGVELRIENRKLPEQVSVMVQKRWDDGENAKRPESVRMQLYRDGSPYGEPVELTEENGWEYSWKDLDKDAVWAVDEAEVPEGYEKELDRRGDRFIITNRMKPDSPDTPGGGDSNEEGSGGGASDEGGSGGGGALDQGGSGGGLDNGAPGGGAAPQNPGSRIPETGDDSQPLLWLALIGVSALGIVLIRRRIKKQK